MKVNIWLVITQTAKNTLRDLMDDQEYDGQHIKAVKIFRKMADYGPDRAVDGDPSTRWATDEGVRQCWIEVTVPRPREIRAVSIDEWAPRIRKYELQHKSGDKWVTFHAGTTVGEKARVTFAPVTLRQLRLNILDATDGPTINEIGLE